MTMTQFEGLVDLKQLEITKLPHCKIIKSPHSQIVHNSTFELSSFFLTFIDSLKRHKLKAVDFRFSIFNPFDYGQDTR